MRNKTAAVNRIWIITILILIPGLTSASNHTKQPVLDKVRPNVLLILADDLGIMDTGINGATQYPTPNIDRLAASGVSFTQAYTNAANCAPSRASLMTGLTPAEHGILTVANSARGKSQLRKLIPPVNKTELEPSLTTIADLFKSAGYQTAVIGKWHLGKTAPTEYGFQYVNAASHLGHPPSYFYPYSKNKRQLEGLKGDGIQGEHLTDRITREAIRYIHSRQDPFLLYLPYYAVHTPIEASPGEIAKHKDRQVKGEIKNAAYAAMIARLDANIGKLLTALQQSGKRDNTLVVFASDNGGYEPVTSSQPYRGAKSTLYEGGIRTPLVLSWPAAIPKDTTNATPVQLSDLFNAFKSLLHHCPAPDNLLSLALQQKQAPDRTLFWHAPVYMQQYAPFRGLPNYSYWKHTPASAVRKGKYKLIHNKETGANLLFDLSVDPGEQHDLAQLKPAITSQLFQTLTQWLTDTHAPLADQPNPDYSPGPAPPIQIYQPMTIQIRD